MFGQFLITLLLYGKMPPKKELTTYRTLIILRIEEIYAIGEQAVRDKTIRTLFKIKYLKMSSTLYHDYSEYFRSGLTAT